MTGMTTILAVAMISIGAEDCTCAAARQVNGWCQLCKVGYTAGIRIESFLLFEELDAHGHDIDPARIECRSCQRAMAEDGICTKCGMGFVAKQAYPTMLAYYLAKGERKASSQLTCATCRKNSESHGWCDSCRIGMVDLVAIRNRSEFARTVEAYEALLAAIRMLDKCKVCAVAMVCDGYCPTCKIRYRNGKHAETKPAKDTPSPSHKHPYEHDK